MASPIALLPIELHITILSLLTFADQIRASQTCTLWQTLLNEAKILEDSRYQIPPPFFVLQIHKLLGLFTHRPNGQISMDNRPVPSGLVFRVENQKLVEGFYYQENENDESIDGNFTNLFSKSTNFLDEPLFKVPAECLTINHDNENVSINLYSKKKMFIFCTEWVKTYNLHAPPTVKELLETIINEAHDELEGDWGVYSDEPEMIPCGLDFEKGCWLAVHIVTDLRAGDIDVCLRRVEFS
ncbi:hypothetical protein TWF173_008793 [Orbilia oligospora]|nr:hypothetical protein TWF173_008793 [Orbilia oligospora]